MADAMKNGNGWSRVIGAALFGALVAVAVAHFSSLGRLVNRDELTVLMREQSPYSQERKWVESSITRNTQDIKDLTALVQQSMKQQAETTALLRQLVKQNVD